jgi:hypothetical protein
MTVTSQVPTQPESYDDYPLMRAGPDNPYRAETFNLWTYDPAQRIGLNAWFGASGGDFSTFEASVVVFEGADILAGRFTGEGLRPDGPGAGNAFATILEPFKRWRYDFLGLLHQTSSADTALGEPPAEAPALLAGFGLTAEIVTPPAEMGSQGDRGRAASSGTIPRTALRYEQLCHLRGALRLGPREIDLDALGVRSHRRNSASIYASGAVGHTWATGLFPSGRGFHLLARRREPSGEVGFCYGNYFDGERYHEAEVLKFPYYSGVAGPEDYELVLRVGANAIRIRGEGIPPYLSGIAKDPAAQTVRLSRAPGRFLLEGEVGGGILERSLRSDFPTDGYFDRTSA